MKPNSQLTLHTLKNADTQINEIDDNILFVNFATKE